MADWSDAREAGREARPGPEAGFTLIEAMIAILILVVGLAAIANLFIVAGGSNKTGNLSTAATTQATEVMERLTAIPFTQLTAGGGTTAAALDSDMGSTIGCQEPDQATGTCVVAGNFNALRAVRGVGQIKTRWQVINPGGTNTYFIRVRSEATAPVVGGPRTRAEFTTFRTCIAAPPTC